MQAQTRCWRRPVLLLTSVLLALGGVLAVAPPAQADGSTKVLLVLDVSGSMNERISSGGTKFAAAKRALKKVADALPAGTQVGLRVYGSEIAEPKSQNPKACRDTELVLPIGPLDRGKMYRAVDSFTAKGETPIAYSLGKAVDDLGTSGKRVLVLISDGEESCSGDPCPTARKLAGSGVDLQFNAIGLEVGAKARKQLQCIATAGDGAYYDAGDAGDLSEAVEKITQRALRPFQTSGTPIEGTVDTEGAPPVRPGQYRDRYDASNDPRFYRVQRQPGSTITASIATIVRPYPSQNTEFWTMELSTVDGTVCARSQASSVAYRSVSVLSGGVRTTPTDREGAGPSTSGPASSPTAGRDNRAAGCDSDPELLFSLARQSPLGNTKRVPVEIVIAEEPPITNLAALPEGLGSYTGKADAVRVVRPVKPTIGGTSYSNAAEVGPGSWSDTVTVGETVFYRVPLQTGQRLRVTANTPVRQRGFRLGNSEGITSRVTVVSPARVRLTEQVKYLQGRGTASVSAASPKVLVRNRETPMSFFPADNQFSTASVAGDYYVALQLDPLQAFLTGQAVQVRVNFAVDGEPAGQPVYAQATSPTPVTASDSAIPTIKPTLSPTDSPPTAGSGSVAGRLALVVGALVVLLAVALGGRRWLQRRDGG